jgi:hypothetical protein
VPHHTACTNLQYPFQTTAEKFWQSAINGRQRPGRLGAPSSFLHPPYPPRYLRTGPSLEFKQLRSLNYERPFSKYRTHNEPHAFMWNCDPSPRQHSAAAERLDLGTTPDDDDGPCLYFNLNCDPSPRQHSAAAERLDLGTAPDDDDGSGLYFNFNSAFSKTAVLALTGSVRHGGIRLLLMAAALSTATAMPLRPKRLIPESPVDEEEGDGSNSDDEGVDATAAPEAVVPHQGGRPGPQPWFFALHVPGHGYGVFSDWDLSAAHGAVGGK